MEWEGKEGKRRGQWERVKARSTKEIKVEGQGVGWNVRREVNEGLTGDEGEESLGWINTLQYVDATKRGNGNRNGDTESCITVWLQRIQIT